MLPGLTGISGFTGTGGIDYVGRTFSFSGSASLTSLSGGSGTAPIEGDYVIVSCTLDGSSDVVFSLTGYTKPVDIYSNGSGATDGNLAIFYKKMTSSPDTSVAMPTNATQFSALVFRGVDQTTPLDATSTTATGTGASNPNSPSITTVTPSALVISFGMCSSGDITHGFAYPTGYTGLFLQGTSTPMLGAASFLKLTAGAEDPPSYTGIGGLTAGDAWCAATIALRPA